MRTQPQAVQTTLFESGLEGEAKDRTVWRWSQRSFLSFLKQETRMCLVLKGRDQPKESGEKVECVIIRSPGDILEQSS